MDQVEQLKAKQREMTTYINEMFNELIRIVQSQEGTDTSDRVYEQIYSIQNTGMFKGRKPIAIDLNGKVVYCPSWRSVFAAILKDCNSNPGYHRTLLELRGKYMGSKRTILSDNPDTMKSPLEIENGLFVETHYDAKALMDMLLSLLRTVGYDYQNITVTIKNTV
jgi:hypothetical protein